MYFIIYVQSIYYNDFTYPQRKFIQNFHVKCGLCLSIARKDLLRNLSESMKRYKIAKLIMQCKKCIKFLRMIPKKLSATCDTVLSLVYKPSHFLCKLFAVTDTRN